MAKRFEKAKYYTEKYKSILAPCKYCGSKNIEIVSCRTMFPPKDAWAVCCTTHNCDITHSFTSVKKAIEQWNETHKGVGK